MEVLERSFIFSDYLEFCVIYDDRGMWEKLSYHDIDLSKLRLPRYYLGEFEI